MCNEGGGEGLDGTQTGHSNERVRTHVESVWRSRPTVSKQGDERVQDGPLKLLVGSGGGVEEVDEEALLQLVPIEREIIYAPR